MRKCENLWGFEIGTTRSLAATLLTLTLLLFSTTVGWSADLQKGLDAANRGDYAAALREWEPLAEQGDSVAQYNLGFMYENGIGVPQSYKAAVKWYTLSAEQGNSFSQNNLGLRYRNGQGVSQDYEEAIRWYTLSAEQGFAEAQINLGTMYKNGTGVRQDSVYAHMWWNIVSSRGFKEAAELRDSIAEGMTPSQIERAKDLARECVFKKYKGC